MNTYFEVKELGDLHSFIGIQFTKTEKGVILHLSAYIDKVSAEFGFHECHLVSTPCISDKKLPRGFAG